MKGRCFISDPILTMQLVEPYSALDQESTRARVERWQREVPLYRELYRNKRKRSASDKLKWSDLPYVTRQDMGLNFPRNFLRDGVELSTLLDRSEVELEHTSGTSGERQPLLLGVGWWNEQESRALRLNRKIARELEVQPDARRVVLASPSCGGGLCNQGQTTARERTEESVRLLSTSRQPWLWSPREWDRIVRDILDWNPLFLDADPVYATALAAHCQRHGIRLPSLRFILSSYEFVSGLHRRAMAEAFGLPVFNLYGATETGHLLMEDEHGVPRASTETAWLEVVEADSQGIGELIVTTMTNEYMPLIRYRIGDLIRRANDGSQSSWELHGRRRDCLRHENGGRITTRQVDDVLARVGGILHYQCVQRPDDRLDLCYLPSDGGGDSTSLAQAGHELEELMGLREPVRLREAEMLLGEPSGKFRLTRRMGPDGTL